MPAPRFYCPTPLPAQQTIALPDAIAHHAVRVLRLRAGDALTLFDGHGGETPAVLEIRGKAVFAQLGPHKPREAESAVRITLAQGLPASGKMDGIVEKAVEMGVHTLVPVIAQRSPSQDAGRLQKRLEHWQRIVHAASAQCGRNRLMHIAAPVTLAAYLQEAQHPPEQTPKTACLLCHPGGEKITAALARDTRAVALCIGPEGGWSAQECELARSAGAGIVRFGARVLRTETAGIALTAAVRALLEDTEEDQDGRD